ncbi:agmatine deiminase [Psychromonas sp. psych-6C06]|uniref:agmatine deiminase family protein n=1 Tax=Psychromonas sp. psych-6C06 TaxID=2058089 RepID=UPI000C332911|nr:agmatine deiminase family protein [Psychromonas sp. psych-6C06]PKF61551.1 agmatine deiminase [Psychromonas sp. psych-6C06]
MSNSYYLPAEWAKQDATLLTWPHQETDWADKLPKIESIYRQLVTIISQFQRVVIVCHTPLLQQHVISQLTEIGEDITNIIFVIAASNDTWARDHGPITLINDQQAIRVLNFTFNGWGNKYNSDLDNQINHAILEQLAITEYQHLDFVLEGGAIESDGQGCLLTTKTCLLNQNRNPHLSQKEIEAYLLKRFQLKKILWLEQGSLVGDDTDAHIDTLARFAPNNQIIFQGCQDKNDPHYPVLKAMKRQLQGVTNSLEQPYQLVELPLPSAQYNFDNERLPATYANFLIINNAVLVPTYQVPEDDIALNRFAKAFPKHQIIAINCQPIIEQFGSLHCLTMQLPQGFLGTIKD